MARDQAVVIAGLAGIKLQGLDELDQRIIKEKATLEHAVEAAERGGE